MKITLASLISTSLFLEAYSLVETEIQEGKDGKCVHMSKLYNPGDVWQVRCIELTCQKYGETQMQIFSEMCDLRDSGFNCYWILGNDTLKFPDCCPKRTTCDPSYS